MLFHGAKAKVVDGFQRARPPQVVGGDRCFPSGAAHSTARLKEPQGQPGRSSGSLSDQGKDLLMKFPAQTLAAVDEDGRKFLVGVELETQDQPHAIPERGEQAVLIGG